RGMAARLIDELAGLARGGGAGEKRAVAAVASQAAVAANAEECPEQRRMRLAKLIRSRGEDVVNGLAVRALSELSAGTEEEYGYEPAASEGRSATEAVIQDDDGSGV
ncbi:MAG TPA: hypothetical protein VFX98_10630, partial [Longimicrobiaceae bacterium]|nr:hypothetical protein [Longimicrobiaceae bacterium]